MNKKQNFFNSLYNAINGLESFFRQERNGKIQLVITLTVITAGVLLNISIVEWMVVLICIGIVLGLEMMNASVEKLCDMFHPGFHLEIKLIKDMSAGAVLLAAVTSSIIGCIIFIPKLYALL